MTLNSNSDLPDIMTARVIKREGTQAWYGHDNKGCAIVLFVFAALFLAIAPVIIWHENSPGTGICVALLSILCVALGIYTLKKHPYAFVLDQERNEICNLAFWEPVITERFSIAQLYFDIRSASSRQGRPYRILALVGPEDPTASSPPSFSLALANASDIDSLVPHIRTFARVFPVKDLVSKSLPSSYVKQLRKILTDPNHKWDRDAANHEVIYEIDGKQYDSIEDVPAEFQVAIERGSSSTTSATATRKKIEFAPTSRVEIEAPDLSTSSKQTLYEIDGKTYHRLEDVPEPFRSALSKAQGASGQSPSAKTFEPSKPVDLPPVYQIGGKTYQRLEDVPEEYRKMIDRDGDGVADLLEDGVPPEGESRFIIEGKEYSRLEDVPAEMRKMLDPDGDGKVNLEGVPHTSYQVDGKSYERLEDVPEPYRSMIKEAEERERQSKTREKGFE